MLYFTEILADELCILNSKCLFGGAHASVSSPSPWHLRQTYEEVRRLPRVLDDMEPVPWQVLQARS